MPMQLCKGKGGNGTQILETDFPKITGVNSPQTGKKKTFSYKQAGLGPSFYVNPHFQW